MAGGGGTGKLGLARLDRHHAFAGRPRLFGQGGKGMGIIDAFDVKTQGGDAGIVQQRAGKIGQAHRGSIAQTGDIGHR